MKKHQLLEMRNNAACELRRLDEESSGRKWTPNDQKKYDELADLILDVDGRIERQRRIDDLTAEREFSNVGFGKTLDEGVIEYQNFIKGIHNTMSTGTGSQGGYTVSSTVGSMIADVIQRQGFMRQVATVLRTEKGNPFSIATTDGSSETGELIGENTAASDQDPSFGTAALNAYMFSSTVVTVPIQLLDDAEVNIDEFVNKRIAWRLAKITDQKMTTGSGSSEPYGIVARASSGKVGTTGQTTTIIYNDIVDLVESVDVGYSSLPSFGFMMSQSARKIVKKVLDSSNRPLWLPSYDGGITKGTPDELHGYPVWINNNMAVPAANAKSIIFGALSSYMIRDVMDIRVDRYEDSAYKKKNQIGICAFMRTGGNLLDTSAVKYYQHSAT